MPRAPLSEEDLSSFRRQAVVAATRLFAERGAEGVTMRALADALGCSPMTAYRYFENQEHLVVEVRTHAFRRLSALQEAIAREGGPPLARVRLLRESYITFAIEEPHVYRLMFSLPPPTVPRPALESAAAASFAPLGAAIADAVEEGTLPGDPVTLAHLVWAEMHGLVSLAHTNKLNLGRTLESLVGHSLLDLANPPARRIPAPRKPKR